MKPDVEFLEFKQPDFDKTGVSLANLIKRRIQSAPGNRWNKTGRLYNSIHSIARGGGVSVVAASDRLQRPELVDKFVAEVMPRELDEATKKAIAEAIFEAIKVDQ